MKKSLAPLPMLLMAALAFGGEKPYADDPGITAKVTALQARTGLMLGKFNVLPKDAGKYHSTLKKGPGKRNYCSKMAYAPDRDTAMYCGGNHGSPHLLNDVWEFHLRSNTWHLVSPPGNDYRRFSELAKKAKKDKAFREGTFRELAKKWWNTCEVKNGYLGAKTNGGMIRPRHTWDGLTYDEHTRKLYWAVLDLNSQKWLTKLYAKHTGQDEEKLLAQLRPASTMYMYDPQEKRWARQLGDGPFPRMHGMGGTLVYLSDIQKTLWYVAAQNRTPNDFGMWSYDAARNTWKQLLGHKKVRSLVMGAKQAPGSELQAAYSPKHKKLVAVQGKGTFIYDVPANAWKRASDTPGYAHDAHSVFAYDSNADIFLLVSRTGKSGPWRLFAYDLTQDKWETQEVKGNALPNDTKKPAWRRYCFAGYYDANSNALVLYEGREGRTWIYRHTATSDTARGQKDKALDD